MKIRFILCLFLLSAAIEASAQGPSSARPAGGNKKRISDETKTKAVDAATSLYKAVPDDLKNKAREILSSPEARQNAIEAAKNAVRSNAGALTAPGATPAPAPTTAVPAPAAGAPPAPTPAAAADTATTPASPSMPVVETPPPSPAGPQPKPLQPLNLDEAPRATKGQIIIAAQKNAFFDANKGYGIYVGDVKARHPQMYIECEELELYMTKQDGGGLGAPKSKAPPSKDADIVAVKKSADSPPIEKADARGPMVTVEKMSETGELQVGHCKHLIYDGKTGTTTLLEWPQVQVGNKLHKATEPGCVMTIDQKGMLTTTGGHQTIILQGEDATPKSRAGTTSPQQ